MGVKRHESGSWMYDERHWNTKKRVRVRGFHTKREADQARSILLDKWRAEKHGIEVETKLIGKLTVADAVEKEIIRLRLEHQNEESWNWNKNQMAATLRAFADELPSGLLVRSLSEHHVRDFVTRMQKAGKKKGTISTYMTHIRAGFREIRERYKSQLVGWTFPDVRVEREDSSKNKLRRVWTPEEFDAVISVLDGTPPNERMRRAWEDTRDFLLINSMTGMRKTEIMLLAWSDVFFPWRLLKARTLKQKRVTFRDIPLSDDLAAVLADRKARLEALGTKSPNVFPPRRGRGNTVWLYDTLVRACDLAGVQYGQKDFGVVPHGLRHTAATVMLNNGVDITTVAEIIGDRPETILRSYSHTTMANKRTAVENLPSLGKSPGVQKVSNYSATGGNGGSYGKE